MAFMAFWFRSEPSQPVLDLDVHLREASPARLVQNLPTRAAFGRLKRLGHSARHWHPVYLLGKSRSSSTTNKTNINI